MKLGTCNMKHKMGKEENIKLKDGNAPCSMLHASWERGFTLLFAVLLGSLLFSLGLAISRIAVREVILSASGKSSEAAFYAADAGIECALYHDIQWGAFPSYADDERAAEIICNNDESIPVALGNTGADFAVSSFTVSFSPVCAEVSVIKRSDTTVIESRGRNICGLENNPGRVERALRVTY